MSEELNELREKAALFVDQCKSLQLATVNQQGQPLASYAPFFRSESGDFYIFVSTLSPHTCNLSKGIAGILLIEDESRTSQIYARTRLGFSCSCEQVMPERSEYAVILQALEERHGSVVQTLRTLADFRMYCLHPESGAFVIGFGQAFAVSPDLRDFQLIRPKSA